MPSPPTADATMLELAPKPLDCNLCGEHRRCVLIPVPPGYAVEICRVCILAALEAFEE